MVTSFIALLGVSFIVIATPGPDTTITIRNTLFGGRAAGMLTALGIAVGQTVWAFATSAGIVAILVASEPLFLPSNMLEPRISSIWDFRRCAKQSRHQIARINAATTSSRLAGCAR